MRPGCDRVAAARVGFDPVALQLWLDPLSRDAAPVQELCEFHVERLTVPRGWSATDRRPGAGGRESTAFPDAAAEPVEPAPVAVEPEPAAVEPEPVAVEPEPVAATAEASPEAAVPAASDRPRERKAPRRPPGRPPSRRPAKGAEPSLLSRAFAWTGPQESILTQGGADDDPNGSAEPTD